MLGSHDIKEEEERRTVTRAESVFEVLDRMKSKSVYEEIVHPNATSSFIEQPGGRKHSYLMPNEPDKGGLLDTRFVKWFVNFDEHKLRPFLIRNYTVENVLLQDAFNDLMNEKFDDKNPEELEQHINAMEATTRRMSMHVNALVQRTKTSENLHHLSSSFGMPAPMRQSVRNRDNNRHSI